MEQAWLGAATAAPRRGPLEKQQILGHGPRRLADADASGAKDQHRRSSRQASEEDEVEDLRADDVPLVTRALDVEHDRVGIRRSTRRCGARNPELLIGWLSTNPVLGVLLEARHAVLLEPAVTELSELAQLRDVATTGVSTYSQTLAGARRRGRAPWAA